MASDLLHVLAATLSGNAAERDPAVAQLKAWEASPGFYDSLLHIVSLRADMPVEVRVQAALTFKNGLDRWRKTSPKSVAMPTAPFCRRLMPKVVPSPWKARLSSEANS
jgi:hypothetical protein